MTERLDLFSTPVLRGLWPDAGAHNPILLSAINQHRQTSQGVLRSNIGGWMSDTDMAHWGGASAISLAEYATNVAGAHMTDVHPRGKRTFGWQAEMWANISPTGAAHQVHCHPGAYWTGVYFLDPGGSDVEGGGGELVLEDPLYPSAYMTTPHLVLKTQEGDPKSTQFSIRPQAGLLVLMPGWLRHSVNQHRGPQPRVSISMNLMVAETPPEPA